MYLQSSIFNLQSSIFNLQSSIFNLQSSIFNSKLKTQNSKLNKLHYLFIGKLHGIFFKQFTIGIKLCFDVGYMQL
jgi:hypothetical protein